MLDKRQWQNDDRVVPQVLIEWQEGGKEGATWEDVLTIQEQFPDFNLEDKVDLEGESNGRILRVYERRSKK